MQKQQLEFTKNAENSITSLKAPDVADYLDYRKLLADFFAYRRKQTEGEIRPYNYQMFSAAADIRSPNYLKMIIEGKRNLSDDMITRFAKAMGYHKEQTEQFRVLTQMNQSEDSATRNLLMRKLSEMRVSQKIKTGEIDKKTWEKIPNWVAWVIYAMVDQQGAQFDLKTLKEILRHKATENEIELALNSLLESGELTRDEKTGEICKARHLMDHADDVPVALVRKLQAQLMYLGLESLFQDAPTEREFGTLTLSMTKSEFEDLKFKLRQLRKATHKDNAIARSKSKGERVYQLNIQLFPITNKTAEVTNEAPAVTATMGAGAEAFPGTTTKNMNSLVSSLLQDASAAASVFGE